MSKVIKHHFVLAVFDAQKTSDFFVRALKFSVTPVDDNGWRFISKDGLMIMLGSCPDAVSPKNLGDHSYFGYFEVDDVDSYYQEILSSGIIAGLRDPEDKPWGMREFAVETPDGHRLMIGQQIILK